MANNCATTKSLRDVSYRTAGFVCKILICADYVSCSELANYNCAVTLALLFRLTARATVPHVWFFILCLCSVRDTSALLCDPKGLRIAMVVCITWMTQTLQHFSNVANSPNILVDVVSSDHRVYSKKFSPAKILCYTVCTFTIYRHYYPKFTVSQFIVLIAFRIIGLHYMLLYWKAIVQLWSIWLHLVQMLMLLTMWVVYLICFCP